MNVLVLKGNSGKSVVTGLIHNNTNNIYIEYYDRSVMFDCWWLDNREYSLDNLRECIEETLEEERNTNPDKIYDYLIVYTNEKEQDLEELIGWMKSYKSPAHCCMALITCKE